MSEDTNRANPTGSTRRAFLGTATAMTAATYSRVLGANNRYQIGFIGYGLIGKQHVGDFKKMEDVDCAAMCDCYGPRLEEGTAFCGPQAKAYSDFRKMYENKDLQGIVVSTPDHWHALQTAMACAAGKDVYVEKPMTLFVKEGRWMINASRRYKRVVVVGTQRRHGSGVKIARDYVATGELGKIHHIRSSAVRNVYPGFGKTPVQDPPSDYDYDMWLGPAPKKSYQKHRGLYHFRWMWDYSGGQMTNLFAHRLDQIHWIMNSYHPTEVYSGGGRYVLEDDGETPDIQDGIFTYPGFTISYHIREANGYRGGGRRGDAYYGTKGTMFAGSEVIPEMKGDPLNSIPRFLGHPPGGVEYSDTKPTPWIEGKKFEGVREDTMALNARDWLNCISSRERPFCDVEDGHLVSVSAHLANISLKIGRSVKWDHEKEEIPGDKEANAMLERPYRAPWDSVLRSLNVT